MKLSSLKDLYLQELKDLYSAESQILKALPKMAKVASSSKLQQAFQEHIEQTRSQISRLDQILQQLGTTGRGKKCEGMEGIISENEEFLGKDVDPMIKDAALIAAAQKVEHYEISGYGTARTFAKQLGENAACSLLEATLNEEKETDKRLTKLAEQGGVNKEAASPSR